MWKTLVRHSSIKYIFTFIREFCTRILGLQYLDRYYITTFDCLLCFIKTSQRAECICFLKLVKYVKMLIYVKSVCLN